MTGAFDLESFATYHTDETRLVLWTLVIGLAVVAGLVALHARRKGQMPRRWVVNVGLALLTVALLLAMLVPSYLESIDIKPLVDRIPGR